MIKHSKELSDCRRALIKSAKRSAEKGYSGDWAEYMFRVHVLDLLVKIASKKKKNPSAYNLFIGKELTKGLSLSEAAKKWKLKK